MLGSFVKGDVFGEVLQVGLFEGLGVSAMLALDDGGRRVAEQVLQAGSAATMLAVRHHAGLAATGELFFAETALKVFRHIQI